MRVLWNNWSLCLLRLRHTFVLFAGTNNAHCRFDVAWGEAILNWKRWVNRWWQTSPVFSCLQTERYNFRWGSPPFPPTHPALNSSYKEFDFQNKCTYICTWFLFLWDFSLCVRGEQVTKYQESPLGNPNYVQSVLPCHANVINAMYADNTKTKTLGNYDMEIDIIVLPDLEFKY